MLAKLAQEIVNITGEVIGKMMCLSRIKTEWCLVQAISRFLLGALRKVEEPLKLWV
ncbi:hypothetical protein [Peribacillus frigoritolerans]|uniref:hypothetical protein n=1 Tax=Peribacillus frigoritolerans TaxID=450367 RepID=UPI00204247C4|nr:hypothetical protein [Peribacillus frigoritolerans]MCM3167089.1 hypothetical protein [Peribacillus frigoritolerans]